MNYHECSINKNEHESAEFHEIKESFDSVDYLYLVIGIAGCHRYCIQKKKNTMIYKFVVHKFVYQRKYL